jgi:hypothetical protein
LGDGAGLSPAAGLAFGLALPELPTDAMDSSLAPAAVAVGFKLGYADMLADGVVAATGDGLADGVFTAGLEGVDVDAAVSFLPPHAVNVSTMVAVTTQTAMVFFNMGNLSLTFRWNFRLCKKCSPFFTSLNA